MAHHTSLLPVLTALALVISSGESSAAAPFDQKLSLQGITFHVTCPNDSSAPTVTKKKSVSDIYLPPITDDPKAAKGYMGHDEFRVVESILVRRFPVYRDGDTNAKPTGGTRQIQYKLADDGHTRRLPPGRVHGDPTVGMYVATSLMYLVITYLL